MQVSQVVLIFANFRLPTCTIMLSGGDIPDEPEGSYLAVGEFARRYAEKEGCWPPSQLEVSDLIGMYLPRVATSFKVSVSILTFP